MTGYTNTPSSQQTEEYNFWLKTVSHKPTELKRVPKHVINYNLCLRAVRLSGFAIAQVPSDILDGRLIVIAMKRDGIALQFVPNHLRSKVICTYACECDGRALRFVPTPLLDEIAPFVLERNGQSLKEIKNCANEELVKIAVKSDPLALQYADRFFQTYDLVLDAVRRNGDALQYVDHALFTDELVETALANDRFGWVGQCLPKPWFNKYRDKIKMLDIDIPDAILNTVRKG